MEEPTCRDVDVNAYIFHRHSSFFYRLNDVCEAAAFIESHDRISWRRGSMGLTTSSTAGSTTVALR